MLDKCYFCKVKVIQQQAAIDYRWGDDLIVIKNVPAGLCHQRGERIYQAIFIRNGNGWQKIKVT